MTAEQVLQKFVTNGLLKSYRLQNVSDDGKVGKKSRFRNTERLTLVFHTGQTLVLDTFCSGCLEDTSISFSVGSENTDV